MTAISTTMCKQNCIHGLLLLILASSISAEHYHIVPNDSTNQCQNYSAGTCLTLAEVGSNISHLDHDNHLTISFLPGEHLLTERLTITSQNITLTGQISSNSSTLIKCQGTSGFEFGDIQSLNIEYLEFTDCGNVSHGGAIFINRVNIFLIKGCHFINNHVTLCGGAVFVNNKVTMNIEASFFNNNSRSASALGNETYAGGAVCVAKGSIYTINSVYMNNSAYHGGAIYIASGNITSIGDYYMSNCADSGGAIYVYSGNFSGTSDQYIHNSAASGGGAIYILIRAISLVLVIST